MAQESDDPVAQLLAAMHANPERAEQLVRRALMGGQGPRVEQALEEDARIARLLLPVLQSPKRLAKAR